MLLTVTTKAIQLEALVCLEKTNKMYVVKTWKILQFLNNRYEYAE